MTTLPGSLCGFGLLKAGPVVERPKPLIAADKAQSPAEAEPRAPRSATPDGSKTAIDL